MDIQRPASVAQAKKRKQIMLGAVAIIVIGIVSVEWGLRRRWGLR